MRLKRREKLWTKCKNKNNFWRTSNILITYFSKIHYSKIYFYSKMGSNNSYRIEYILETAIHLLYF